MSTLADSLLAQITAVDAQLSSISATSVSADGVSLNQNDWISLSKRRNELQQMYDRVTGQAPMMVRMVVTGLRR